MQDVELTVSRYSLAQQTELPRGAFFAARELSASPTHRGTVERSQRLPGCPVMLDGRRVENVDGSLESELINGWWTSARRAFLGCEKGACPLLRFVFGNLGRERNGYRHDRRLSDAHARVTESRTGERSAEVMCVCSALVTGTGKVLVR